MRRKLIQVTIVSSLALLFLFGALYVMIVSSHATSSSDANSSLFGEQSAGQRHKSGSL